MDPVKPPNSFANHTRNNVACIDSFDGGPDTGAIQSRGGINNDGVRPIDDDSVFAHSHCNNNMSGIGVHSSSTLNHACLRVNNGNDDLVPVQQEEAGEWVRAVLPTARESAPGCHHVWESQDGLRINFRGTKFTVPRYFRLSENSDTTNGELLEFYVKGDSKINFVGVLDKLRSQYSDPKSPLYRPNLQFDLVDDRLYVTMPSGMGSDLVGELVIPQLRDYQSRVRGRLPTLILSGSSSLVEFDGVPIRLCGDGSIVEKKELYEKTLEVHRHKRAVTRNLKVYVNFEALSFFDSKSALIEKCEAQVATGQALVSVAICDREGDGEVLVFYKTSTPNVVVDRSYSPKFIDLNMVIPTFRVYLSYGASFYFQAHHGHDMKALSFKDLKQLLCESIAKGDTDMAKEVINGLPDVNEYDGNGRVAMVSAAATGDKEMLEYLLVNGGTVDITDSRGVSPLLVARAEGFQDVADLLVSLGATIDVSWQALVEAVQKPELKRLELLLKAGAVVDEIDTSGRTTLIHAVMLGRVDAMRLLVSKGAVVDKIDTSGRTALIHAVMLERVDAVRLLVSAGASCTLRDGRDHSARFLAQLLGNKDILDILG